MKLKITVILAMLLLFALTGCNNTPQTEKMPEPFSFSESNEQTSKLDTLLAGEETNEVETTPESMQSTEPVETESVAEVRSTESSKPKEPEPTTEPTSAPQEEPSQTTEESKPTATATPETEVTPPVLPAQQEKRQKAHRRRKHRPSQNPFTIMNLTLTLSVQN